MTVTGYVKKLVTGWLMGEVKLMGFDDFKSVGKGLPTYKAKLMGADVFKSVGKGLPTYKIKLMGFDDFKSVGKGLPTYKKLTPLNLSARGCRPTKN